MIYMYLFWLLIIFNFIYFYLYNGKLNEKTKDNAIMILMLASAFLILAILTKDPIFSNFGVPNEFEWVIGLFITCLTSWKLYFAPLKERVIMTEKEVSYIKSTLSSMQTDLGLIKQKLIK